MKNRRKKKRIYYTRPKPQEQDRYFTEREKNLNERDSFLSDKQTVLDSNQKILDDTLHEIRKINNQIKGNINSLKKAIDRQYIEDDDADKFIRNTLKTIEGNATLLSIRMNAYDIMLNPASATKELDMPIVVFSKVEKVYKCLYSSRKEKNLEIILNGNSTREYRLRNSIELAFFIIIENAIKYSPEGDEITITFEESVNSLKVEFHSWGICPGDEEMIRLTERGYRSKNVVHKSDYEGSGLGLYLLKQICEANNVLYMFEKKSECRVISGIDFHPFVVTLRFCDQ